MRKFKYGCGEVTQNFLLNYSLFKITLNPSKKVEFSSEKQKYMSDDGTCIMMIFVYGVDPPPPAAPPPCMI